MAKKKNSDDFRNNLNCLFRDDDDIYTKRTELYKTIVILSIVIYIMSIMIAFWLGTHYSELFS